MGKYIAILSEKKKGALTNELLEAHVHHLKVLKKRNELFLCGPFQDNDGAMQILIANTYAEAEACLKKDPFIRDSYYAAYTLYELIEANEENNYLMEDVQTKTNIKKS